MNQRTFDRDPIGIGGGKLTPPSIPPVTPPAITNQNRTTLRRAVLHAVSPNTHNPATASVLIENKLPPRPGFSLPSGFGPVYLAGTTTITANGNNIVINGPYFNNPATNQGGSFVLVDTATQTVIQLLQGTSSQFPSSAAVLIAGHVHTGGVDAGGNPQPSNIDLTSHTQGVLPKTKLKKMPSSIAPVLVGAVTQTDDHAGYPIYNVTFGFTLNNVSTTDTDWLDFIRIYAIPAGGTGKSLIDLVQPIAPTAGPGGNGTYSVLVGGLSAGVAYNVYVTYVDISGGVSNATLLGLTDGPALDRTNLPGLGTLPVLSGTPILSYPIIGLAGFDALVQFSLNWAGTKASSWCGDIELVATLWDAGNARPLQDSSGHPSQPSVVNIIAPNDPVDATVAYFGDFTGLIAGNGKTANIYNLDLRFVAYNGDKSSLLEIGLTDDQPNVILRHTLAKMPNGTTPQVSGFSVTDVDSTQGNTVYDTVVACTFDALGTIANPWLDYIEFRAVPTGLSPVQSFGSTTQYNHVQDTTIIPNGSGVYSGRIGNLASGTVFDVYAFYIDHQGNISVPSAKLGTTTGRAYGVNPNPGNAPVVSNVYLSHPPISGQTTFSERVQFTTDSVGTTATKWLRSVIVSAVGGDRAVQAGTRQLQVVKGFNNAYYSLMVSPSDNGVYDVTLSILGTGFVYSIYVNYLDNAGVSTSATLLGDTLHGALTTAALPSIPAGTTFSASATLNSYGASGHGTYNANVTFSFTVNSGSGNVGDWLDHIGEYTADTGTTSWNLAGVANSTNWGHINLASPSATFSYTTTLGGIGAGKSVDVAVQLLTSKSDSSAITGVGLTIDGTGKQISGGSLTGGDHNHVPLLDILDKNQVGGNGGNLNHLISSKKTVNTIGMLISTQGQMPYFSPAPNGNQLNLPSIIFVQQPFNNAYSFVYPGTYYTAYDNLAIYMALSPFGSAVLQSISQSSAAYDATVQNPANVVIAYTRWEGNRMWFAPNGWSNSDHLAAAGPFKPAGGKYTSGMGWDQQGSLLQAASNFSISCTPQAGGVMNYSWESWNLVYPDTSSSPTFGNYANSYSGGWAAGTSVYVTAYYNTGTNGNVSTSFSAGVLSISDMLNTIGDGKISLVINQFAGTIPSSGAGSTVHAGSGGSTGGYGGSGGAVGKGGRIGAL